MSRDSSQTRSSVSLKYRSCSLSSFEMGLTGEVTGFALSRGGRYDTTNGVLPLGKPWVAEWFAMLAEATTKSAVFKNSRASSLVTSGSRRLGTQKNPYHPQDHALITPRVQHRYSSLCIHPDGNGHSPRLPLHRCYLPQPKIGLLDVMHAAFAARRSRYHTWAVQQRTSVVL